MFFFYSVIFQYWIFILLKNILIRTGKNTEKFNLKKYMWETFNFFVRNVRAYSTRAILNENDCISPIKTSDHYYTETLSFRKNYFELTHGLRSLN